MLFQRTAIAQLENEKQCTYYVQKWKTLKAVISKYTHVHQKGNTVHRQYAHAHIKGKLTHAHKWDHYGLYLYLL